MNLIKINKYNGVDQKDLYVAYGGGTKYNFENVYLNNCSIRYQKFSYDKDVNYDMDLVNESEIIKNPFFEDTNGVDDFQCAINNNKKYADEIEYIINYDNRYINDIDGYYDNHITIRCLDDIDKFFDKFVEHEVQEEHDKKAVRNNTTGLLRNLKIFNVLSYIVIFIFWFIALCFADPTIITTNPDNVLDLSTFGIVYGVEICIFLAFAINENKSNRVYNILSFLFVLAMTIAIYGFQLESLGVNSIVLFETVVFLNAINDSIAKSFMKEYDIKY